ncbi:MAG: hypothetical protein WA962_00905 [Ornithinimicrobium sp.]
MGTALMTATWGTASTTAGSWSGSDFAVRFGMPTVVVLIGLTFFLAGRTERRAVRSEVAERGGFGGPPGTGDVGDAQGFGVEQTAAQIRAATRKVLIGLIVMLVGSLTLLGVTFWGIFS